MTLQSEQSNAFYKSEVAAALKGVGAISCGKAMVLPRVKIICPEFEIQILNIKGEILYQSSGCHLFSDIRSQNRDEFIVHKFIDEQISTEIINLVSFYHISKKTLKAGDIIEIGNVENLPHEFSHVLISQSFFFSEDVNKIKIGNFIYYLLWILPICKYEYEYIQKYGLDEFEIKMENSQYDFFDLRSSMSYLTKK